MSVTGYLLAARAKITVIVVIPLPQRPDRHVLRWGAAQGLVLTIYEVDRTEPLALGGDQRAIWRVLGGEGDAEGHRQQ